MKKSLSGLLGIFLVFSLVLLAYAGNGQDLIDAAYEGNTETVKILLANGADVNAKDDEGRTALMTVAGEGHTGVAKTLLDHGADINTKDKDGKTALFLAEKSGHSQVVRILKEAGAKE